MKTTALLFVVGFALYVFAGVTIGSIAAEAITDIFAPINAALAQLAK